MKISELDNLLSLTRQMLDAEKENNWGEVAKFEKEREIIFKQFFGAEFDINQLDDKSLNMFKELLNMNNDLLAKGILVRKEFSDEIAKSSNAMQAIEEYGKYQV